MNRFLAVLTIVVTAAACGGGNSAPGAPSENIPSFAGNWSGVYAVTGCNQSGDISLADICGILGNSAGYTFSLTQTGRNVSGSFALGGVSFPSTSGSVANDGTLALSATSVTGEVRVAASWVLNTTSSGIGGSLTQRWTATGLSGEANVAGRISNSARTSTVVPSPATSGAHSLTELVRAIAVR
jgi:hypothetical protein